MKNFLKKTISILLVAAVIAVFGLSLAACNKDKDTYENLTAEQAEDALFNSETGAVILMRSVKNAKVDFSKSENGVVTSGSATLTSDGVDSGDPVCHSNITVVDGGVTTVTESYVGYAISLNKNGEETKSKTKVYRFYKVNVDGTVTEWGAELLVDTSGSVPTLKREYNSYINNCGVYDANSYLDNSVFDVYGDYTVTCSGAKHFVNGTYKDTEITVSYSYPDGSATITGTAVLTLTADGAITAAKISESTGYNYSATYTYGLDRVITPAAPANSNKNITEWEWQPRTAIE